MKEFSKMWIDGTESVKKDSLEKQIKGEPHKRVGDLELKGSLRVHHHIKRKLLPKHQLVKV